MIEPQIARLGTFGQAMREMLVQLLEVYHRIVMVVDQRGVG